MSAATSPYRLLRLVHEGLYGPIHQAEDASSRQPVALQILTKAHAESALPLLEAQTLTLGKLRLPNIRRPLAVGRLPDAGPYIAWEWADAQPLKLPLAAPRHAIALAHQLAAALESCHQNGIVHGFLRSSQILVEGDRGSPHLHAVLGVGVQRALGLPTSTLPADSMAFLAPELRDGAVAEHPSADLYGLGQILRALLGLPLGEQAGGSQHIDSLGSLSLGQRQDLSELLKQLLQPKPERRPAMSEVSEALLALQRSKRATVKGAAERELRDTPISDEARAADPLLGQTFGSFRLTRCLGRGGMGAVYEAKHRLIGTRAAVKVLLPDLGAEDYARRFLDEARAVNIISHPGVVSIFEFGQRDEDNRLFIVMEFLQGQSLESFVAARKTVSLDELLPLLLQLARAIEAAHRAGIVHRDLKPSNVMLVPDPLLSGGQRVKVVDFGIAKVRRAKPGRDDATEVGAVMGTPFFMAPEQYGKAEEVTGKADVFALGVIIFEALSGKLPFGKASTFVVITRSAPPLRSVAASVPVPLARLVDAMLNSEPDARPSMSDVVAELERINKTPSRRWKLLAAAGGAVALIGGVTLTLATRSPSSDELEARFRNIREHASRILRSELAVDRPSQVRSAAARALGSSRDGLYRDWLIPLIQDADKQVACAASRALSSIGDPADGPALSGLLDHPDLSLRLCVASALTHLTASTESKLGQDVAKALLQDPRILAKSDLAEVRAALAADLLQVGQTDAIAALLQVVQSPALTAAERIHYLELIATSEEAPVAITRLRQIATDYSRPAAETLGAAASLNRLGFSQADDQQALKSAREQRGPNQLLAMWLTRGVPDKRTCALFWDVMSNSSEAEERRQLAAEGLTYCGHDYAAKLDALVDTLASKPLLRIASAESLLRMVGPDSQHAAAMQHRFAHGYQSGALLSDRLAFIDSLSGLPDEQVISAITQVLSEDGDETIRKVAARSLKPVQVRSVLHRLAEELGSANGDVSENGQQAIAALLGVLQLDTPAVLGASVRTRILERLRAPGSPTEEIILRLLLLRAGERDQGVILRSKLPTLDRLHKLLAIELSDPDDPIVSTSLSSSDPVVQLAAARRRAMFKHGDPTTSQVLADALKRRGPDSLVAFYLLRGLGETPAKPAHLTDLLGRAEPLPVRWEAVRLLALLPLTEARPLLMEASNDPAVVIRREVVQVARAHYERQPDLQLLDMVRLLASDPELPVRLRAIQFLQQITNPSGNNSAPIGSTTSRSTGIGSGASPLGTDRSLPAESAKPAAAAGKAMSVLQVQIPGGMRAKLTGKGVAQDLASSRELQLPAGRYQLTATCDETLTFELKALERKVAKVCEVAQAVEQIRLMRQAGQLEQANAALGRLMLQLRGKEQSSLYDRVRFERGELRAASGNLREALDDYNHVWGRHLSKPLSHIPTIDQKLALLRSRVGRLSVYQQTNGRCVVVEDSLQMPGQVRTALLTQGVMVRAGEHVIQPDACRK